MIFWRQAACGFLVLGALLGASLCSAQAPPKLAPPVSQQVPVPPLTGHVMDQTNTLTEEQQKNIEQELAAFEARKGSQLAVLMVPSTQPETIEQYALRVAEQWKLGRKKVDDGAILVVAKNDRTVRIEVGYGLEGALPAAIAANIIQTRILPAFKRGDMVAGVVAGSQGIMQALAGEYQPVDNASKEEKQGGPWLFILVVIVMIVLHNLRGGGGGGGRGRRNAAYLVGGFGAGRTGGGFGGGGGFSGGGGSFGGGGASGGW